MPSKFFAISLIACFLGATASAEPVLTGPELARARNCLSCHQVDSHRVGPPYIGVAERYAGQAESEDYLVNSIRNGGKGKWGAIPMPAQPKVSEEDARALARWILSLKPAS